MPMMIWTPDQQDAASPACAASIMAPPTIRRHLPDGPANTQTLLSTSPPTRDSESENTIANTNTANVRPARETSSHSWGRWCDLFRDPGAASRTALIAAPAPTFRPSQRYIHTANPGDSDSRRIKVAVPSPAGGPLHSCNRCILGASRIYNDAASKGTGCHGKRR
ncbi:hypothetical protein CKAH01_14007 [Colletotrichum kahawae]|uniref:Uncharacterized protein n=1 Tax=Colletotrichum kahawae TaxID=34407 RepID=A0AAD9YMV6_COLKA|nr:hypothetical protein CKAH01_14007 [Colletotrichum kahawae]